MARRKDPTRRKAILDVAADLFYRQGYSATGIQQIIKSAGISKGALYTHFQSKEEIGAAWLETRHQNWLAANREKDEAGIAPAEQLMNLFDQLPEGMRAVDFRGCAFMNTSPEVANSNPMRTIIKRHKTAVRQRLQMLLATCFPNESEEEISSRADLFYLLLEAAIFESQLHQAEWPLEAAKREIKTKLEHLEG